MLQINKLYHGDCLDLFKKIEDSTINLIFCSPPYESKKDYGEQDELGKLRGDKFVNWFEPFFNECKRVIKPSGNIFINFQGQITNKEYSLTEQKLPILAVEKCGLKYVSPGYWFKTNAHPDNYDKRLKNCIELIWHFVKDIKEYTVYKDSVREVSEWAAKDKRWWKYNPAGKDPGNVFICRNCNGEQKNIHPAKMIDELSDFYIKYGSKEGDLVLDPFAGGVTSLLSCRKYNRNFIGFEKAQEWYDKGILRLNNEKI